MQYGSGILEVNSRAPENQLKKFSSPLFPLSRAASAAANGRIRTGRLLYNCLPIMRTSICQISAFLFRICDDSDSIGRFYHHEWNTSAGMALRVNIRSLSSAHLVTGSRIIDAAHPGALCALQREAGVSVFEQSVWRWIGRDRIEASWISDGARSIFILRWYAGCFCAFDSCQEESAGGMARIKQVTQ